MRSSAVRGLGINSFWNLLSCYTNLKTNIPIIEREQKAHCSMSISFALALHWRCIDVTLALHWRRTGVAYTLVIHWRRINIVLPLHCIVMFGLNVYCPYITLNLVCARAQGPMRFLDLRTVSLIFHKIP